MSKQSEQSLLSVAEDIFGIQKDTLELLMAIRRPGYNPTPREMDISYTLEAFSARMRDARAKIYHESVRARELSSEDFYSLQPEEDAREWRREQMKMEVDVAWHQEMREDAYGE